MCALFPFSLFLKSSEMAGNESKINKRNNNLDDCSLFLISIRHMIKKDPPRISETKLRMT